MHVYGDWSASRRTFWTKRKRATAAMMAVMGLLAGMAIAFKLFDQVVPNNVVRDASTFDFVIEIKRDGCAPSPVDGAAGWCVAGASQPIFPDRPMYPGDERLEEIRIANRHLHPPSPATFFMHVDQRSIVVTKNLGTPDSPVYVPVEGAAAIRADHEAFTFANFFLLDLQVRLETEARIGSFTAEAFVDVQFRDAESCQDIRLLELSSLNPCRLATIDEAGSRFLDNPLLGRTDIGFFRLRITEESGDVTDPQTGVTFGIDQSRFKDWSVTFPIVFNAMLPACEDQASPSAACRG